MSTGGGKKAIVAAFSADAGITVAKYIGAFLTGSASMLAEAVHSTADTANQGLLLLGRRRAEQAPDDLHPFGYGRNRYFYSFIVALVIFLLGALYAIDEGITKIRHPERLDDPIIAIVILLVALALESYSLATARRESAPLKGRTSWWKFIRTTRNPELPVVLLEDTGALIGLLFAFLGVGLTMLTGSAVWDGIGTLLIGGLLLVIAIVLIVEMKSLLIGEGATPEEDRLIRAGLVDGTRIDRVIHLKTQYLAPDDLLVATKVSIVPGLGIAEVAAAIDDAEERVRAAVPTARDIYIEPDLYRARSV
ncbi:cation diffusion facilitator family transporter [Nocardia otitidiscaviarum]|uniref:Cation diffusion facilitator family transporter n=1 Tax=Nocardia otitidiscaviarum TaxID=1823 RepID=A0A516NGE3_9NOCA|nr:cation diffusion facilitator family transporter [Nocardia otitidiscaviarum]MCP9623333.1 cation diffusion facilitator family transporter [Nocardia otitidiscaviarum]QDP77960.1 cation diffusion facilitator family transporter [Nocardia otitidiscaviarum]